MIEYIHLPEVEEIGPSGGSYQLTEVILDYNGRDVLCVRSESTGNITFCRGCGIQGASSIFIKGRIVEWKAKNEKEEYVSRLEAITDRHEQQEIKAIVQAKYKETSIYF